MISRANARMALTAANALQKACRAYVAWCESPTAENRTRAERKQALYMRHRAAVIAAEAVNPVQLVAAQLVRLGYECAPGYTRVRLGELARRLSQVSIGSR